MLLVNTEYDCGKRYGGVKTCRVPVRSSLRTADVTTGNTSAVRRLSEEELDELLSQVIRQRRNFEKRRLLDKKKKISKLHGNFERSFVSPSTSSFTFWNLK